MWAQRSGHTSTLLLIVMYLFVYLFIHLLIFLVFQRKPEIKAAMNSLEDELTVGSLFFWFSHSAGLTWLLNVGLKFWNIVQANGTCPRTVWPISFVILSCESICG